MLRALASLSFSFFLLLFNKNTFSQAADVAIVWRDGGKKGSIHITKGDLISLRGTGKIKGATFSLAEKREPRLVLNLDNVNLASGPTPTIVHVKSGASSFSFFLRDVNSEYPIFIPHYGVAVLPAADKRIYQQVESDVNQRKTKTKIQRIETEKETSFESVASQTRDMSVPIWLGISRDMRMFEVSEELQDMGQEGKIIRPRYASSPVKLFDSEHRSYIYALGRGVGVKNNITRFLDQGSLPIYHSKLQDDDILYHSISFVSLTDQALTEANNKGTDYVVSDKHSYGRSFKDEHLKEVEEKMKTAYEFENGMALFIRTAIKNTGTASRYAWIKAPRPGTAWWYKKVHEYDAQSGFSYYKPDRIFSISLLNGHPLENEEMAILLQPGQKVEYDIVIPHTPITTAEGEKLKEQSFTAKLEEARKYWNTKLASSVQIELPEERIQNMLQAGLFHLDLITYGKGPDKTVSANIGVYSPIGTESSPIIQFYLSMGWHDLAKRALDYFLDTQLSNGYIQNYEGYTVETGAALWSMGEYFRYTNDREWLSMRKEKMLKSCDYLIEWRNKNKKPSLAGRGFGMIDGKVADPEDHYHQFMLNGYAYLGLSRIAEILRDVDVVNANRIGIEAEAWKADIVETVKTLMGISPVVPLGDGTWVPTLPPWAEADGIRALYQKKETFWSHGTFTGADALLGPLYLVFCEVIAPESKEAKILLDYHSELFFQGNAAFSQPYYSRHNWLQVKTGMVKPFLNTYYNTMSAHADRETYTFWEHMYRVSQHKTHEEAWFLMETRWMLYIEEGDTLSVFKTIPRVWMEDGKSIRIKHAKSYFGNIDVEAQSDKGKIVASIIVSGEKPPKSIRIRLPHPDNKKPITVTGGKYDPVTETVMLSNTTGKQEVILEFGK